MADDVMVELVRDELRRISDRGDLASRSMLRESVGVGSGDLERALSVLRERGEASEVEPDGYRYTDEDEPETWPGGETPEPGVSLAEAEAQRGAGWTKPVAPPTDGSRPRGLPPVPAEMVRVQLDSAVAGVMDAGALGKLVEAGITKAAERGVGFMFEVTP